MTNPAVDPDITPDDKDWTWTLRERCPDCGFVAASVPAHDVATRVTASTDPWPGVLARADATARPRPSTWSPLEYACHVRDVCRLFEQRLRLVLAEDEPTFANWDQDETAVAARYREQDPAVVAREVVEAAAGLAGAYAAVPDDAWERTGTRSDGSVFTVLTLGQYGLHDLVHHLWDVGVRGR
ncbi:maleylpyruvate isomerase N-terminal domain-containing protein [Fodinibacter luteus]|uniref:Maleylpyruvate isomerase N-terminal domain-containing protein n=1 Tax=Fodinibacter luteus TaxID=552064 RepID=A0ABP8KCJ1_9MICO